MHNTSEMRDEAQAQALRTFAGNGFGDAAIGHTQSHVLLESVNRGPEPPTWHCAGSIRGCCATSDSIAANSCRLPLNLPASPITPALV